VEARSELRGKKRVALKPPMDAPAIVWSHEVDSPRSYREMEPVLTRQKSGTAFLNKRSVTVGGHAKEGA
jgi:hypothetical protein